LQTIALAYANDAALRAVLDTSQPFYAPAVAGDIPTPTAIANAVDAGTTAGKVSTMHAWGGWQTAAQATQDVSQIFGAIGDLVAAVGNVPASVWAFASRTMTAVADSSGVTALLGRLTATRATNLDRLDASVSGLPNATRDAITSLPAWATWQTATQATQDASQIFGAIGDNTAAILTRASQASVTTLTTAVGAIQSLDAAGVRAALGMSAANLDVQLGGLSLGIAAAIEAADAATQAGLDAEAAAQDASGDAADAAAKAELARLAALAAKGAAENVEGVDVTPKLNQILDLLQTDPPTQTGEQQYRARKIIRGDSYGPGARPFGVSRHRSASWPLDLSAWSWAITFAKDPKNDADGGTLAGSVGVTVATGESRSLEITITSDTSAAAVGRHVYAIRGTRDGLHWSPELGVVDVQGSPADIA
jgi:hypothetical protein